MDIEYLNSVYLVSLLARTPSVEDRRYCHYIEEMK